MRSLELTEKIKEGKIDSNIYRGEKGYIQYIKKSESDIHNSKFSGSLGPISNSITSLTYF
jgi:hypothetical protein